jgi:translation initiation factor 2B subunit (eIF-2B alpha/beta/delta family)
MEQRIAAVRADRQHGSRWLVREAILILRDLAMMEGMSQEEQMRSLYSAGRELAQARPAMAALSTAVGRILNVTGGVQAIAQQASKLLEEYDSATEHIAGYAQSLLQGTLLTCSISGTVLDVLVACRESIQEVIVLEGRPRYEGRDMARALSKQSIAVTLITDAQADIFLPQCNAVVVGADSILANGDVLNKAGTALLAWAARGHQIPFYVLCETLKISPNSWSNDLSVLEEKEPEEVIELPIAGVIVHNFYFDRTPYHLVTKVVTEHGILEQQAITELAAQTRSDSREREKRYANLHQSGKPH